MRKEKPDWFGLSWFFGLPILAVAAVITGKSLGWQFSSALLTGILLLWVGAIFLTIWRSERRIKRDVKLSKRRNDE